ncbi:MAG: hypothetical protein EXS13_11635 [Planctomycetes bacterium]|nr:hypothetical protein [Planctomycetota bacterium]
MDRHLRFVLPALLLGAPLLGQEAPVAPSAIPAEAPPSEAPTNKVTPVSVDGPRGLLGVAETEATRSAHVLKNRIVLLLRNFSSAKDTAADRGKALLDNVVAFGPDAVPLLLDVLREVDKGSFDAGFANAASRALCGIFERTKNKAILASLNDAVQHCGAAVKAGALDGLAQLDHPLVIDIVAPLIETKADGADPLLAARAVLVLGFQKSSAECVGQMLRPLLTQQGSPLPEVIQALHSLGDRGAIEAAHGMVAKSDYPVLLLACVRYLADTGGRTSIPPLRALVLRADSTLPDTLLKQAIDAAQAIGLRETDAQSVAEELLLEAYKKLRVSRKLVSEYARWQLGPFQTAEALKTYEDELEVAIQANRKMGVSNTGRYIELAEDRLRFEAWRKAADALDKAKDEDTRSRNFSDRIDELRAVAFCGQGKYTAAEKLLQQIHPDRRQELLQKYPMLKKKMADEPRYKELFPLGS